MNDERETLRVWLRLLSASNALKKAADTAFRAEFGLSIARFDVMAALDRAGKAGLRAGALSQQLMVSDGATTQVTAPLVRDGLVKRRAGKDDARVAIFSLTRKGARIFEKMAAAHRLLIRDAFAAFSDAELAAFRRLLGKIAAPDIADARKDAA